MNGQQLHRSAFLLVALGVLAGCGKNQFEWKEEVKLQSGETIMTKRTAKAKSFGQIGGPGGWENEGMTLAITGPIKPDNPAIWGAKFVPLVFDRDPDTNEWFIVATFATCSSWYDLGRPHLPYTEFRFRDGQWVQQALSEKFIGREGNMLTSLHYSGEPDHTIQSKHQEMSRPTISERFKFVSNKWTNNC